MRTWDAALVRVFQYICKLTVRTMYTIQFNFEQEAEQPLRLEHIEGGQTLLEIALENKVELNHRCGGVCSCTTCHLYIVNGIENIASMSNREEDYLKKVVNANAYSRLGCQSLLLEGRGDISVIVPRQSA
jgi:2Fe-2S ferredoxin